MEKNLKLPIGSIVQINPDTVPEYPGDFCIVTEVKERGIQGYLALTRDIEVIRVLPSRIAFIRLKWEDIELVGKVEWIVERKHDEKS